MVRRCIVICASYTRRTGKSYGDTKGQRVSELPPAGGGATKFYRCKDKGSDKVICPEHGSFWVCKYHVVKAILGPAKPGVYQPLEVWVQRSCPWCEDPEPGQVPNYRADGFVW